MNKGLSPILDAESFKKFFEGMKDLVFNVFQEDKYHTHIVFLIDSKGLVNIVPFDFVASKIKPNSDENDFVKVKDVLYRLIASLVREKKCVGYFEVGEAFTLLMPECGSPEEIAESYQRLMEKYGGTLANVPTRMEILYIAARWRDIKKAVIWRIERNGDEVWLRLHSELDTDSLSSSVDRLSLVDRAIDDVICAEEKGGDSPK